jgi:hypothetical protein
MSRASVNHERRTPRRSGWPQAVVLGAATVGLALVWLLADPAAPPPPDGAAVMLPAPASPPSDGPLPEIQDPPAIALDELVDVEAAGLEPDAGESEARRRPIPGTERAYREAFVVKLREPGVDVDALLDSTIHGNGPDAEKVALLRALLDIRSPKALDALVTAAEEAESHDGPAGVGVPEFCVRMLTERAARDADARAALGRLVARRDSALEPRLRRTAAARLALTGTSAELALLAADIRGCGDPELLLGVARSLEFNPEAASARGFFSDLPAVTTDGEEQPVARN